METKKFLSKLEILQADDLPIQEIQVPHWGGFVRIRSLTSEERDRFEFAIEEDKKAGKVNVRARLVALVVVDENGKQIFSDLEAQLLARKNGAAMDLIFDAAAKANGLTSADVKDLEKNSGGTQSGG